MKSYVRATRLDGMQKLKFEEKKKHLRKKKVLIHSHKIGGLTWPN